MSFLDNCIGTQYYSICDAIQQYANDRGLTVLARESDDSNIDVETDRLNIWLDQHGKITRFTIG